MDDSGGGGGDGGGQGLTINQSSGRDGKVVKLVSRLQ